MNKTKITLVFLFIPLVLSIVLKVKLLTAILITFAVSILIWDVWVNIIKKKK